MKKALLFAIVPMLLITFSGCAPRPAQVEPIEPLSAEGVSLESFEDPGGMWMPRQLEYHRAILEALGVEVADTLSDPLGFPLGAIVNFGGCSSSFVSPEGLIITNHHCAISSLQYNSTPEENMLQNGFLAKDRADERPKEAGSRVYVCQEFIDVTDTITHGLNKIKDDLKRHDEIENRIKKMVKKCETAEAGIRASVKSYFEGDLYVLIKQLEIKDIRLVYAPASGIGYFGGDVDNWHWPRHCGDYAFFRAYVGPDGKPADYSPDNVPYRPKHYLKLATTPLRAGDFVMVAGFPGRTSRLKTADEAKFTIETANPFRIYLYNQLIALLDELGKQSEELEIKVKRQRFGYMNSSQYMTYLQESLQHWNFLATKEQQQADLISWINQDPRRIEQFGTVLDEIEKVNAEQHQAHKRNVLLGSLLRTVDMLGSARDIVRMAEERPKSDARRDPAYQKRNWDNMIQGQYRKQDSYDRAIDQAMLRFHLAELIKLEPDQNSDILQALTGQPSLGPDQIDSAVDKLYHQAITIEDVEKRVEWLKSASMEGLGQNDDAFIQMALRLHSILKTQEDDGKRYSGKMAILRPRYMQALRQFVGGVLAPDANSTLRVTYGKVHGYRPQPDDEVYDPFTTTHQIIQKNTGEEPFNAPDREIQALRKQIWGPYIHPDYNEVTVDFLSDVDTTGGNSGSATMNNRGELVGLLFDGITEGLVSDWMFVPEINRSIHADIRYVLWIMDYVDRAHDLLREMNIEPSSIMAPKLNLW